MNETTNLMSMIVLALSQVQSVKDKIDPEVFELLNKSGHESISIAHHFLDACEKALDSVTETKKEDEIVLDEENPQDDNVVTFSSREA